jgi:hypothetical protein
VLALLLVGALPLCALAPVAVRAPNSLAWLVVISVLAAFVLLSAHAYVTVKWRALV